MGEDLQREHDQGRSAFLNHPLGVKRAPPGGARVSEGRESSEEHPRIAGDLSWRLEGSVGAARVRAGSCCRAIEDDPRLRAQA